MRLRLIIFRIFTFCMLITLFRGGAAAPASGIGLNFPQPDTIKAKADTSSDEELEEDIIYWANDSVVVEPVTKRILLYGDAHVDYGTFSLNAAFIEIDNKNNLFTATGVKDSTGVVSGNPEFKDGENEMRCEKVIYNTKTKKGKVFGVLTRQAEMLVYGEQIKKDTNDVMYIKNAKCIPCEHEDAKIYFRAKKAKVIPDDKIVTGPIFLEVSEIPTPIGLPFGYFPNVKNKSKAGIIIPFFGQSPNQGVFLQNGGFYIPFGSKMDMQIRGDIFSSGSYAVRTTNNYFIRYKYQGSVNLEYKEIHLGEPEIPENQPNGLQKLRNFAFSWSHSQDAKFRPNSRFSANVNVQSGLNNKYNPVGAQQYLTNTFFSNVAYSRNFRTSSLSLNARHNQNTLTRDIEITFPELTFYVNRFYPFKNENRSRQNFMDKFGIDYTLQAKAYVKTKDSLVMKPATADSIQYGLLHRIPMSTNISILKYFTLTPSANLSVFNYFRSVEKYFDTSDYRVKSKYREGFNTAFDGNAGAALATKLYGDYLFKSKLVKQIRHQVIPTVGFTWHPDLTSSNLGFFKDVQMDTLGNRLRYSPFERSMYGAPVGAKSGAITFGINNTLDAAVRERSDSAVKFKKVALIQMFSVGGYYDIAAKKNPLSIITLSGRTSIYKNIIGILAGASYDPYALDSNGRRSEFLEWKRNGVPARLTSANGAINITLSNTTFGNTKENELPWNFSAVYNVNYSRPGWQMTELVTQTVNFSFNFQPTKNWQCNVLSGVDFKTRNFSYTRMSIRRDLRCWEAGIDWVPFGFNRQYTVTLNLKTSAFRDIKIPRTRQWYDNL